MNAQDVIKELQSLDMENPGAWPGWVHTSAAVLLALVLSGLGIKLMVMPGPRRYRK